VERREEGKVKLGEGEAEARYIFVSLDLDEKPEKSKVSSGDDVQARENDEKPLCTESALNT